ncbi:MAG: DUF1015 domain-containing protein [Spirochaetaceae bacterium]|nr:MAG: DUF1015 domain-containing protein [Spirochaetaceae bacterium]
MQTIEQRCAAVGIQIPDIWLPAAGTDLNQWAVIACDQHTSNPEYWRHVEQIVAGAPSTLSLIFPEVYLGARDRADRITRIAEAMRRYEREGILSNCGPMAVLVQRSTPHVPVRTGLVVALDLERYDFRPDSTSLIRATEGTILDRLPPRVEVRRQVSFELPHVLVLIDDPDTTVIEPLATDRDDLECIYEADLMLGGGSVRGYAVNDETRLGRIADALAALAEPGRLKARYGRDDAMLFAVGDGNHSLATAKQVWEERKAKGAPDDDPARYALVELINMHDPGLHVEPIHRVVSGISFEELAAVVTQAGGSPGARVAPTDAAVAIPAGAGSQFALISDAAALLFETGGSAEQAPAVLVQNLLENLERERPGTIEVDYIHGTEAILSLCAQPGRSGFLVPAIRAETLFGFVANHGPLPRKIFSLGEAEEKRYYLEARKIV